MQVERSKKPGEIEKDIEQTRTEMDSTLTALEKKFMPGEMVDRLVRSLGGAPKEYALSFGRAVRDNPIPAALVGIGLTWLMFSRGKERAVTCLPAKGGGQSDYVLPVEEQPTRFGQRPCES